MITNLAIERLYPHPSNPRKDLGDLSELAESIKSQGVLQNLTVVPWNFAEPDQSKWDEDCDRFVVIIGHRRLAAAKLAGLAELPCVIVEMDERTQIGTMLAENMQRSDLTLVEEAEGMQMMLDLGESVKDISSKTGLSETTVRRRVRLVREFDRDALLRVQDRQIRLEDYEKLYEIKDEAVRADIFEKIGTRDFEWAYNGAIGRQQSAGRKAQIHELLATFATQVPYSEYQRANIIKSWTYYRHESQDIDAVKLLAVDTHNNGTAYYYTSMSDYDYTTVFTKDGDIEAFTKKASSEYNKEKAIIDAIKALFAQAYATRLAFAKNFRAKAKQAEAVDKMAIDALFSSGYFSDNTFRAFFGIEKRFRESYEEPEKGESYAEARARILGEKAHEPNSNIVFAGAYCRLERADEDCVNYHGKYELNEKLALLYKHLCALGYEMSEDETALMDGTHSAYANNDGEEAKNEE